MKNMFVLPNPGRELLFDDLPDAIFPLHSQNDPIAAVITHINSKQTFLQSIGLAEVKFSQSSVRFHQFGELDIPDELYLHKVPFEIWLTILVLGLVRAS
jgi:hypothetical protein